MSHPPELRAPRVAAPVLALLSLAIGCGSGRLAPHSGAASAGDAKGAGAAPVEPDSTPRPAAELDPAAARALGPVPRQLGRFRLDPYARVRSFGNDAAAPLERACDQILGPGCAGHGLEHVLAVRYVDAAPARQESATGLDVIVSRYEDGEGAFARFGEDLIGQRDPLELSARALDVPRGLAVLDGERVAGWMGRYLVSLVRSDRTLTLEQRVAAAAADLPEVAAALLAVLPAEPDLPLSVQKLPRAQRLPLGVRLPPGDALGVPGAGRGAIGYYRDGDKRWRVLAIARPDVESARDVFSTLARSPAARRLEKAPLEALAFTERRLPAEPLVGWVVGQHREVIYGIGDEANALPENLPAEREAAVKLSLLDKLVKLTKVHLE